MLLSGGGTPAIAFAEEAGSETASESTSESSEESSYVSVDAGAGETVTHTGDANSVSSYEGGSATVNGNVTDYADSDGKGSSTTVNGNADRVYSSNGGSATVNGNVTDYADSDGKGSSTTVNGNADCVSSSNGGSATVNGNVTEYADSDGEGSSTTVNGNTGDAEIYAGGSVTVSGDTKHIMAWHGGSVSVEGNVSDNEDYDNAIYINLEGNEGAVNIIKVNGTVSYDDKDQAPIVVWGANYDRDEETFHPISEEELLNSLDITLWKINPNKDNKYVDVFVGEDDEDGSLSKNYSEAVAVEANIKYIIKVDNSELSSSSETGKAGESITIKVKEGYTVSDIKGGTATLTKNADGTYTLVVPAGGGVEVSAVLKAIENLPSNNTQNATTDNQNAITDNRNTATNTQNTAAKPDAQSGKDTNTTTVPLENTAKVTKTETSVPAAKSTSTTATKTATAKTTTAESTEAVQTGDTNNALPYAVALIASAAGITAVVLRKKAKA